MRLQAELREMNDYYVRPGTVGVGTWEAAGCRAPGQASQWVRRLPPQKGSDIFHVFPSEAVFSECDIGGNYPVRWQDWVRSPERNRCVFEKKKLVIPDPSPLGPTSKPVHLS